MKENDIKKYMLMSLQRQNSFQRKQAGSWKIHKCSVSVSCIFVRDCCIAKSSEIDCFIDEPNMPNVVVIIFQS